MFNPTHTRPRYPPRRYIFHIPARSFSTSSARISGVDTRDRQDLYSGRGEGYQEPGLGTWIWRNRWLLMRIFVVMMFTLSASLIAGQFAYMLEGKPTVLSAEQINAGKLPQGTNIGDYVEITGTPKVGNNLKPENIGAPASEIGVSARYDVSYFYFRLNETGNNFLIQSPQDLPGRTLKDFENSGKRVWKGRLDTVGGAIFHNTTQEGLTSANLPHDKGIPIIETGDTPGGYRHLLPVYLATVGVWLLSVAWLVWKKNKPFLGP